ncbi:diguanylate cyclase [Thalassotalea insulae]|uniref:Diguanylate cyclase n=1 Tax=Thalassotalea insulae TaxID=2056778 RepID=A0ABQ6GNI9_9GAMM|nr:EAL domain-containing protein [Thalassotalea insulae]GLX77538.1 diguanylate cyclase [Thalassotalea insulae]
MQPFLIRVLFSLLSKLVNFPLLLLGLIVFSTSINAVPINIAKDIKVKHLTNSDGLSQSFVYDMIEDPEGLIWIATQDGLNIYNGKDFKHYRNNINDANSLADNIVRKLYIDSKHNIWVGTQNGLSKYNSKLDNFINYYFDANDDNSLADNVIWDIYEDKNNQLWISTEKGLHTFVPENNHFNRVKIRKLSSNSIIKLKEVNTIFQDNNNKYWLASFEQGFIIVNQDLLLDLNTQQKIQQQIGADTTKINQVQYQDKHYWLATNNGVYVLDENYLLVNSYFVDQQQPIESRGLAVSNNAHVWVATDKGLRSVNPLENKNQAHNYANIVSDDDSQLTFSLLQDSVNKLWIGTSNGLFTYEPTSNLIHHSKEITNTPLEYVNSLTFFNQKLWLASDSRLIAVDSNEQVSESHLQLEHNIFYIIPYQNSLLLFSDDNKLHSYNPVSKVLSEYKNWDQSSILHTSKRIYLTKDTLWFINNNKQLSSYDLTSETLQPITSKYQYSSLYLTNNQVFLTSTENTIVSYDIDRKSFLTLYTNNHTNFQISNATTIKLSKKFFALGSDSQGLLLINRHGKSAQLFNESNLLANNFISDIVIDNEENFWLSTNKGISVIYKNGSQIRNFYHNFFLENNEFLFQSSTIANNTIYLGNIDGFHYFSPDTLLSSKQQLQKPLLTALLVANKEVKISSENRPQQLTLSEQINSIDEITLSYFHSPFSLEFVSPNAKLPSQVGYRYKLKGLDANWIETDQHNLRATYTNLSSGNYQFEVQAYDLFTPSITKSKSINIKILPPWWLSNSAILIYALAGLLILAYLLQQFRHKRLYHLQIKASEERLKLSLWGSGDEMWDWNIKQNKIYRSNIWGILEFPQDGQRNLGNSGDNETNVNKADIRRITQALKEHFDEKTEHFEITYRVKDKNNQWIWILDRGKVVERDDRNKPVRMTGTLKDISQIKKADERLKLFAKCIENISDAVVIYDRGFNIVDVNQSFQRITGKNKQQMLGTVLNFSRYPDAFTVDVKKHLLTKGSWHGEIESKRENGEVYLTDLNIDIIRDDNKSISHFVGVFSDITKRKETEAELRKLANTDTLTGLPNRSYFQAHQTRLVNKKIPHALLVFDLDNFKKVNDSMGHEVGDILLCKVAERLRSVGRKHDTIYRLGGDEFSLIVEETNDIHTITTIAKTVLKTIAQPLKLKSQEIVLYSSIGIVLYPEDGITPHDLLKNADTAMYHAKHAGGNQYQFFNGSMNKQAVKRLQIESLIRHGLKEDYFSVFYQPKIEISTGKIAGMEALVRFETPSKGIISPVVFIPVSEETGQIIDIGEIVLRKACYATKEWIDAGLFDGRIAVNLSAIQFTQPNLVGMIKDILTETKLPAQHLELEITEGTVMDSPQKAIETMLQIRALGIHLSLDDFGTGYSSLAYLKKFPLNTLKIDKAFVDDIETSEQGRNMVATIVTIAHNLGLQVVAEGVESNQQLSFLSGLRCEQLQGYLYSKPLPQEDFRRYLLSHQITDKSTSFN